MNKKTFLVTGAAGFLGSHLVQKLAENNRVVAMDIVDNLPKNIRKCVKFYKADASDLRVTKTIFEKERPQVIYHLAGPIALRREIDDPLFKKNLDVLGNLNKILDCCVKYKAEKIIFFSSGGAIYEKAKKIPTSESYPAHPSSLYGLANLLIESYLKSYFHRYGLKFTVLRLSNVYGPRQWESGIIPSIVLKLLKKEAPIIHGNGKQTRDFVFVEDVVKASIVVLKDEKNSIYNIGSDQEISINEILNKIATILNKPASPIYISKNIGGTERSCLNNLKIRKELKWQPKVKMEQGLIKTVDWLKSNYDG